MTQKELLYIEDAIEHEKSIITYLEEMKKKLEQEDLIEFSDKESKKHQKEQKELEKLLEEKAHEWSIFNK